MHKRKPDPEPEPPPLTSAQIEEFRETMIERKRAGRRRVERFRESSGRDTPQGRGEISSLRLHPADTASEAFEQEKEIELVERESAEIADIDAALERMEEGSYGVCERCGRRIPPDRLSVIPWAPRCMRCQAAQEERSRAEPVRRPKPARPRARP